MKIEIITIGDEILIGQVVDTNSAWMASQLTQHGFHIEAITSVGDSAAAITKALDIAFSRADILLLTGGVGPTKDDITKNTLCDYFDTSLQFNQEVLDTIERLFSGRNLQLNALTRNQALVPEKSSIIQNKVGTAPILWFEQNKKLLISMPGVPFEMRTAMTEEIIPRLQKHFFTEKYIKRGFLVAGITESGLATLLSDYENELPPSLSLAYLPAYGLIRLRLSGWGEQNASELSEQAEKLNRLLGNLLISESEKSLEALLGERLRECNLTISSAESCTGGLISHKITSVSGASTYFKGSIVCYANQTKENILKINSDTIASDGAVSQTVVEDMATHCAQILQTDCAIAVSGIAGPDGGSEEKPVGTVWICTYNQGKTISRKYNMGKSRDENIARSANMALLQMLRMI